MKQSSIRCDICNIELYYEMGAEEVNSHKPIMIPSFVYDSTTSYPFAHKHFCSPKCVEIAVAEQVLGVPIADDCLKSLAEKLGYTLTKIPKPPQENKEKE